MFPVPASASVNANEAATVRVLRSVNARVPPKAPCGTWWTDRGA